MFGWSPVKSGAVVLFVFVGNVGIKPATTFLYGRFGFRSMLITATLLLAAYTHWSGGFPWYFADLLRPGAAQSWTVVYTATACWIVLVIGVTSLTPVFRWAFPPGRDAQAA